MKNNEVLKPTGTQKQINPHGNLITASSDGSLKDIFHHIKTSKSAAVINFGASWCHVCGQILPSFNKLSNKLPKLGFIYADIYECPETTQHIRYTPTFQFFRDGERVDEMYGADEPSIQILIDSLICSTMLSTVM